MVLDIYHIWQDYCVYNYDETKKYREHQAEQVKHYSHTAYREKRGSRMSDYTVTLDRHKLNTSSHRKDRTGNSEGGIQDRQEKNQQMIIRQAMMFAQDLNQANTNIKISHQKLHESYLDTIKCLVMASEFKDGNTGNHLKRIGRFSVLIAQKLDLPEKTINNIRYAAPMHDIGKIGIPDHILMKKGNLTRSEFTVMKTHTLIGAKILCGSNSEILQMAHNIALSHHEKWNGEGYPCGLKGHEIPLEGRIVSLCDFFDALTSKRSYRDAFPLNIVFGMIKEERDRHFDPRITDIFLDHLEEIKKKMRENGQSGL